MKPTSPTSSSSSVPTSATSTNLGSTSTPTTPTSLRALTTPTTSPASATMLASASPGSHTPPPTRAGGVLKRLRQILWEGVGRLNEDPSDEPTPLRTEQTYGSIPASGHRPPTRQHTIATAGGGGHHTARAPPALHHEHLLKEALKRMSKHSPLQTRLALVNALCEYSRSYSIDDVLTVWGTVKDLVAEDQPSYARALGYEVMLALIEGQYDRLGSLRMEFFATIQRHKHNFVARLKNLVALTKNGHNVAPFENDLCQLLLTWLERGKHYTHEIIAFAAKVVKYNPYTLADAPKTAFIGHVCAICNTTTDVKLVESCLNFFDILVRYSHIPERSLVEFINALCRTLNIEACCQRSWMLMTNVLKSPCGHQGVIALCATLDNPDNVHAVNLLRGAVFYLSMASWGSHRIPTLHVTRSAVLPYLLRVLNCKHNIVAYEVALSMCRLIKKYRLSYGPRLQVEWDVILRIIRNLLPYLVGHEDDEQYSLIPVVRETLEVIHELHKNFEFMGSTETLIELLEDFSAYCNQETILHLIAEKQVLIHPAVDEWQHHLHRFLLSHLQREHRAVVQSKALGVVEQIFGDFHVLYGDEIISVVLPVFDAIYASGTVALARSVYRRGLDFLVQAASVTKGKKFFSVADVLEKASRCKDDRQRYDAIASLIRLFVKKFPQKRHAHTLHLFDLMIKLAKERHPTLRAKVIVFLLSFRANPRYHMQLSMHRFAKPPEHQPPDGAGTVESATAAGAEASASTASSGAADPPTKRKLRGLTSPLISPRKKEIKEENKPAIAEDTASKASEFVQEMLTSPYVVCWRTRAVPRPSSPPPAQEQRKVKERIGLLPVAPLIDTLVSALQIEPTYEVFIVVARGLMEMLKNYYILRAADMCSLASVLCKLLRSGTFGACIDPRVRKDTAVRGRLLEIGYEMLVMVVGYQSQLKPKYREYLISCLCEGLTSNLSSIPAQSALAVQRICINGLSICLSELPESMGQRISAIVGDMHKVCERNLESKRHMQMPEKSELARHVLEFFSFLLDAPLILSSIKDDDRQRLFLTLMLLTDQNDFAAHVSNHAYIVWADFFMASPVHLRLGYYRTGANYLIQRLGMDPAPQTSSSPKANAADPHLLLMATLDLFAQSVFGNCDNTPLPPPESSFLFDNSGTQIRTWAQGNCIIRMRVGKMGWVEIVVRRPAGSQRWIMQIQNVIHQVAAPLSAPKSDDQLKKCIEEAPWMFTHLLAGDSLLHDRQSRMIPERTVSDTGVRARPIPIKRQSSRSVLVESLELQVRKEEPPPVAHIKRSRSAPSLHRRASGPLREGGDAEQNASALEDLMRRDRGSRTQPLPAVNVEASNQEEEEPGHVAAPDEDLAAKATADTKSPVGEERPKRDRSVSEKIHASGAVKVRDVLPPRDITRDTAQSTTAAATAAAAASPAAPPTSAHWAVPPPTSGSSGEREAKSGAGETRMTPKAKEDESVQQQKKRREEETAEAEAARAEGRHGPLAGASSFKVERKWTDSDEQRPTHPVTPTRPPTESALSADKKREAKGKEKIEHWRKKFISKVGAHQHQQHQQQQQHHHRQHGIKVVLPPAEEGGEPNEPSGADIPRRRSFSEVAAEDSNAKARRIHKRHASTVEFSLSVFYPPLPSYEGSEEEKSPPLFVPPRHGGDALLWKRGRCVSLEHVDLTNQTLSIEGQMLLHAVSSSPKSLDEPALLLRASPPSVPAAAGQQATLAPSVTLTPPSADDPASVDEMVASPPTASTSTATGFLAPLPRAVSLELENYTPPEGDGGLSLEQEVQNLLPPEFNISPSPSLDSAAPTGRYRADSLSGLIEPPPTQPALVPSGPDSTVVLPSIITGGGVADQQPPRVSETLSPSLFASAEVATVSLQGSGETSVADRPAEPVHGLPAPPQTAAAAEPRADEPRTPVPEEKKKEKSKGGSIRKEKDQLVLLGDGLISPNPSGRRLQDRETDEKEADVAEDFRDEREHSFFMVPRLSVERPPQESGTPTRPAGETPTTAARKERRTSILHNLFSVSLRKTSATTPPSPSAASVQSGASKPFRIPATLFDIHPSFVYSQMKNIPFVEDTPPKELKSNDEALSRALSILDRTPTTVCAKVGIIYVGEHQETEEQILANTTGSPRYISLLNRLGDKIRLKDTPMYAGGLDTREDTDGHYTVHWRSVSTQVVYHVVTMIPHRLHLYPGFQNKKRHIGNDNVHIVYSDSPKEYEQDTILGQFNFVHIVVHPLKEGFYRVEVKKKPQVPSFGPITNVQIVSERAMATLVRQVALSANLAACLVQDPQLQRYSNLEERLRQLRKIAERFAKAE